MIKIFFFKKKIKVPAELNDTAMATMRECVFQAELLSDRYSSNLKITTERMRHKHVSFGELLLADRKFSNFTLDQGNIGL